jgi:hypothetical protein
MHSIGRFSDIVYPEKYASEIRNCIMKRIKIIGAGLALLAGIVAAHSQGIGYAPGVNPSNPQDLTHRSNRQDLSAPGGSNRQDLVRRSPGVNASTLTSPSRTPALRSTVKTKQKARRAAARR